MAIIITENPSGLKMKFDCGKDPITGRSKVKTKTYSNLKHDALDADLYDVSVIISDLQVNSVLEVTRVDSSILSE